MAIARNQQTTNSINSRLSRYVQGGSTTSHANRLGWWERQSFDRSIDDVTYTVTPRTAGRPDLIAYDLYNRATMQWFVLQYNLSLIHI